MKIAVSIFHHLLCEMSQHKKGKEKINTDRDNNHYLQPYLVSMKTKGEIYSSFSLVCTAEIRLQTPTLRRGYNVLPLLCTAQNTIPSAVCQAAFSSVGLASCCSCLCERDCTQQYSSLYYREGDRHTSVIVETCRECLYCPADSAVFFSNAGHDRRREALTISHETDIFRYLNMTDWQRTGGWIIS